MQSDTAVGNYSDGTNQQAKARRSHPAQHGEGFDAPPTIKRSGSEHRRAVTSLALLERARAWEWVKDPLFARRALKKMPIFGKTNENAVSFYTCELFSDIQIPSSF